MILKVGNHSLVIKARREKLANRMKDNDDPLQIVIVRDMWLTGFDVPAMNTMYLISK